MDSKQDWIITEVDGKIASVSTHYSGAAKALSAMSARSASSFAAVRTYKLSTEDLFALSDRIKWEDLLLFGTAFQKKVWKQLFDLSHNGEAALMSYVDFAASLGKASGVRSVAHAVGLNPVAVIIPCHLIIPKESIVKIAELMEDNLLFKLETLYMIDQSVNYGEYAPGARLKRSLIHYHLNR